MRVFVRELDQGFKRFGKVLDTFEMLEQPITINPPQDLTHLPWGDILLFPLDEVILTLFVKDIFYAFRIPKGVAVSFRGYHCVTTRAGTAKAFLINKGSGLASMNFSERLSFK
jgi:hypothetical protein